MRPPGKCREDGSAGDDCDEDHGSSNSSSSSSSSVAKVYVAAHQAAPDLPVLMAIGAAAAAAAAAKTAAYPVVHRKRPVARGQSWAAVLLVNLLIVILSIALHFYRVECVASDPQTTTATATVTFSESRTTPRPLLLTDRERQELEASRRRLWVLVVASGAGNASGSRLGLREVRASGAKGDDDDEELTTTPIIVDNNGATQATTGELDTAAYLATITTASSDQEVSAASDNSNSNNNADQEEDQNFETSAALSDNTLIANTSTSTSTSSSSSSSDSNTKQQQSNAPICSQISGVKSGIPSISVRIVFFSLYGLIFAIGLLGNTLTLYAMRRKREKSSIIDIFIANLALSDIMLCIFAVPITPIYMLQHGHWVFGPGLCKAFTFAQGSSVYISTFTMISIAHVRYQLIVHPLHDSMSKLAALLLNLCTWILGFLVTLPYLMHVGLLPENCAIKFCDEHWDEDIDRFWFSVITLMLQFFLPFTAVSFFYGSIFWKLRLQKRRRQREAGGRTTLPISCSGQQRNQLAPMSVNNYSGSNCGVNNSVNNALAGRELQAYGTISGIGGGAGSTILNEMHNAMSTSNALASVTPQTCFGLRTGSLSVVGIVANACSGGDGNPEEATGAVSGNPEEAAAAAMAEDEAPKLPELSSITLASAGIMASITVPQLALAALSATGGVTSSDSGNALCWHSGEGAEPRPSRTGLSRACGSQPELTSNTAAVTETAATATAPTTITKQQRTATTTTTASNSNQRPTGRHSTTSAVIEPLPLPQEHLRPRPLAQSNLYLSTGIGVGGGGNANLGIISNTNTNTNTNTTISTGKTDILAMKELRLREKDKRLSQTNRKLLFMVVLFVFSWLPLNMFNLVQDYSETISESPYIKHVFLIVHLIACSSVCYNPILYAWMSDNYRQELRDILPSALAKKCCCLMAASAANKT